jgi:hypothetical protein
MPGIAAGVASYPTEALFYNARDRARSNAILKKVSGIFRVNARSSTNLNATVAVIRKRHVSLGIYWLHLKWDRQRILTMARISCKRCGR